MILYTPVPMEAVFPSEQPELAAVERDGRFFSGVKISGGIQITRLCSTCPADYLRPDWQPGCVLPPEQTNP